MTVEEHSNVLTESYSNVKILHEVIYISWRSTCGVCSVDDVAQYSVVYPNFIMDTKVHPINLWVEKNEEMLTFHSACPMN